VTCFCVRFVLRTCRARCGGRGEMRRRRRRGPPPRGADGRPRRVRRGHASGSGAVVIGPGHAVRGEGPRRHGAALRAAGARGGARRPGPGAWPLLVVVLLRAGLPPRLLHDEVPSS
jgi:hypothetical protein